METLLLLLYNFEVVERGMDIHQFSRFISMAPARRYELYPRKEALVIGADAGVTVIDPALSWTVEAAQCQSVARWSPYDGMELTGRVTRTLVRGTVVFDGRNIASTPGDGVFVPPL